MKAKTKQLVLTKKGQVNKSIIGMLNNCIFDEREGKIYTGYYSGSGRFTTRHSAKDTVTAILNAQGYSFSEGNDAPAGGAHGEYVKVSKVAFNFISNLTA